jgi:hypothetical protein
LFNYLYTELINADMFKADKENTLLSLNQFNVRLLIKGKLGIEIKNKFIANLVGYEFKALFDISGTLASRLS